MQINGPPAFPTSPTAQAEPAAINSLVIGFANPAILYAATSRIGGGCVYSDSFFFKSTDGGGNWSGVTNLPIGGCGFVFSPLVVTLDPSNLDDLYRAGGGDCGGAFLENTSDGAANWTTRGSGFASTVNSLVIDPTNPAVLYAGTPEGAFKTTNGGMDWTDMGLTGGVSVIAIDQAGPRTLYAATGGSYSHPGFRGMFKSTDGGANWTPINNGLDVVINDGTPVTALAIALDTSTLYAATSGKGVYKSGDGGANWVPFNQGLSSLDVRGLALAPKTPMTLYAVTSAGSFRFIDEAPSSASALLPNRKLGSR